ncbi:hypothetical protein KQ304_02360 [Synechococcus sp. CS-1329]|uniref:hypothetical protein n=1 Tax=Synechococcus sp. CS-1329 TaxID=2847975 RepID=UPI00223B7017|nr:hypothetical protein [Synechococcus sp. CS-1329]MCT0217846.1 hypothetical protein [Synechococcus sp. CS-1329]
MAGIQTGDEVIFTAKVQRCTKGLDQYGEPSANDPRGRRQVIGLGNRVRDVVVSRRGLIPSSRPQRLKALEEEIEGLRLQLSQARSARAFGLLQAHAAMNRPHLLSPPLDGWDRCQPLGQPEELRTAH